MLHLYRLDEPHSSSNPGFAATIVIESNPNCVSTPYAAQAAVALLRRDYVGPSLPPLPSPARSRGPTFPVSFDEPECRPNRSTGWAERLGNRTSKLPKPGTASCLIMRMLRFHAAAARLATFATVARLQPVMS